VSNPTGLIDTASVVDRVYNYLLSQITDGQIRYGQTISIKEMAGRLSVSTMPVREALKRLAAEQIVTIKPRSGCQVRVPTRQMMCEIMELRELIELHALTRGIESPQPSILQTMRTIVGRMKQIREEKNQKSKARKMIALDRQFHQTLIGLCRNETIGKLHRDLLLHVNIQLIHERQRDVLDDDEYYESHAGILACLEHGTEQDARKALRRHFRFIEDTVIDRSDFSDDEQEGS
jgi:DNA-binding GntR family transcriptional regulator